MSQTPLMINGIPGKVATAIAGHVMDDDRFRLLPYSLTGPETEAENIKLKEREIGLIKPDERDAEIGEITSGPGRIFVIDFTHPTAVNSNAAFYIENRLPFVMGTTGGDREKLEADINSGTMPAVVAPNMAKQIVGFQAMMAYAAENFPDLFNGFSLEIKESHQKGKADTSGTAKAMVRYFNRLGIDFSEDQIEKERDPQVQLTEWGVPEDHLQGHGFHTYTLRSPDGNCMFRFEHNICGREIYVHGAIDAVFFLKKKLESPDRKEKNCFSMIDVLKNR